MSNKGERYLDPNIKCTIADFRDFARFVPIPSSCAGWRVLDLGSSESEVVSSLRKKGANAYGIDPLYAHFSVLDRKTDTYLKNDISPRDKDGSWREQLTATRTNFKRDFRTNPGNYLAALCSNLPFRNNVFDVVFSNFCLCPVISQNEKDLLQSFRESLRVLKPGGLLCTFPFDNTEDYFEKKPKQEALAHQAKLDSALQMLQSAGHNVEQMEVRYPAGVPKELRSRRVLFVHKKNPLAFPLNPHLSSSYRWV